MLLIGFLPALGLGLSALSGVFGARQQGKANNLREQALGLEMQRHNEMAPLRSLGLGLAQQGLPQAPDLSAQFADPSNPFAVGAAQPPAPQPPPALPVGGGVGGVAPGQVPGQGGPRGAIPLPMALRRPMEDPREARRY